MLFYKMKKLLGAPKTAELSCLIDVTGLFGNFLRPLKFESEYPQSC